MATFASMLQDLINLCESVVTTDEWAKTPLEKRNTTQHSEHTTRTQMFLISLPSSRWLTAKWVRNSLLISLLRTQIKWVRNCECAIETQIRKRAQLTRWLTTQEKVVNSTTRQGEETRERRGFRQSSR
ncbi:hypothetical protein Salat_2887200 [Sesamum alatum]|uniref:Uncharacterized protein n=1 Tax=Sesamum alatum TaxID=300844 RepID=A0AAE1XI68_9LAMI|nr:hypothetical protein Salat_2887200 [Sesamum alatum]